MHQRETIRTLEGSFTPIESIMHKLGNIEGKLDGLTQTIEDHHQQTDNRLKPLEATNKRLGWLMGAGAGFGAVVMFLIEKIGAKWLNLF